MSAKYLTVLFFGVMLALIDCKSFCQYIKRNDKYNGIQIYRKYGKTSQDRSYVMNSGYFEWNFKIEKTSDGDYRLNFNDSFVNQTDFDPNVVNRFGIISISESDVEYIPFNCKIISEVINKGRQFRVECIPTVGKDTTILEKFPPFDDFVLLETAMNWVLVFDRKNVRNFLRYPIFCRLDDKDIPQTCKAPPFITQLSASLIEQIEGIVHYHPPQERGVYLVLFNIGGQPKYCFALESSSHISQNCKNVSNMEPLFEECFPEKQWFWLIVGLVVLLVIIVILIVIAIICCRRKRKGARSMTKSSVTTAKSKGSVSEQLAKADGKFEIMKFKTET